MQAWCDLHDFREDLLNAIQFEEPGGCRVGHRIGLAERRHVEIFAREFNRLAVVVRQDDRGVCRLLLKTISTLNGLDDLDVEEGQKKRLL